MERGGALPCQRLDHLSQSCLPLSIVPFFLCSPKSESTPKLPGLYSLRSPPPPPNQLGFFWGLGKVLDMRGAEAPEDPGGPGLRGRAVAKARTGTGTLRAGLVEWAQGTMLPPPGCQGPAYPRPGGPRSPGGWGGEGRGRCVCREEGARPCRDPQGIPPKPLRLGIPGPPAREPRSRASFHSASPRRPRRAPARRLPGLDRARAPPSPVGGGGAGPAPGATARSPLPSPARPPHAAAPALPPGPTPDDPAWRGGRPEPEVSAARAGGAGGADQGPAGGGGRAPDAALCLPEPHRGPLRPLLLLAGARILGEGPGGLARGPGRALPSPLAGAYSCALSPRLVVRVLKGEGWGRGSRVLKASRGGRAGASALEEGGGVGTKGQS